MATALSTTCLVASVPASTYTRTYSSGQPLLIPATTLATATTLTRVFDATIVASCFTLTPGQTAPLTIGVPGVGVSCETTYQPGTTKTDIITSGEVFQFFATTATRDVTNVYTLQPTSYVSCRTLPDYENPATCDTVTPLTWASLILTFITIQLTWWIFEVPLLWKRDGGGFKAFFDAVTWSCLRANMPSSAGVISLGTGIDTSEYARVYYLGMRGDVEPPRFTTWKLLTCCGSDLLTLIATGITVYQACTLPEFDARRFGLSLWTYPALPTAVIGLCFLAGQRFLPRTRKGDVGLWLSTALTFVVVGLIVALVFWRFNKTDDIWFFSVIIYGIMGIPAVAFGPLIPIATLYGIFARVGGVGIAALRHHNGGQPYCKLPGAAFGAVYLALGGLSGFLALAGVCYHYPRKWMNFSGRVRGGPPGPMRGVMDPDQLPPDKNWANQ